MVDGGTDTSGDSSEKLENLAEQEKGDTMENDNKTEENVYPSTHWTIWVLGLISIGALVAFALNLSFNSHQESFDRRLSGSITIWKLELH